MKKHNLLNFKTDLHKIFYVLVIFNVFNIKIQAQPLQGQVEDSTVQPTAAPISASASKMFNFPTPVVPPRLTRESASSDQNNDNALQGKESQNNLNGYADQNSPMNGQLEKPFSGPAVLKGAADYSNLNGNASSDPDAGDRELQVKWDLWRNRFLWAVQSNMQSQSANPSETMMHWDPTLQRVVSGFPVGLTAWFACEVTDTGQIIHLKIMHSSGVPYFDNAVLRAVYALQGAPLLRFPQRSKRRIVSIAAGIKSVSHAQPRKYYHFGDVEQYSVPDN